MNHRHLALSLFFAGLLLACGADGPAPAGGLNGGAGSTHDAASGWSGAGTTGSGGSAGGGAPWGSGGSLGWAGSAGSVGSSGSAGDAGAAGGPAIPPVPCTKLSQLADSHGLTDAMRQTVGSWYNPPGAPTQGVDFSRFTQTYGVHPTTFPPGDADNQGFGYPGLMWGLHHYWRVSPGKFVAMEFRAPTHSAWAGTMGGWNLGPVPDSSFYTVSIARCPGQFSDDPVYPLPAACAETGSVGSVIIWDIGRNEGGCSLEPGQTYYLNAISAVLPDLATTTCTRETYCSTPVDHTYTATWPKP